MLCISPPPYNTGAERATVARLAKRDQKGEVEMRKPETKLERVVAKWLKETGKDYENSAQGAYDDLMQGGCESGMVGKLIYYSDTLPFYRTHKIEIAKILAELCDEIDGGPVNLFGDKWYTDDPLALETQNQNLLAWFGFEETARHLMED